MPKVGDLIDYRGQRYVAADSFERRRVDGSTAIILVWESNCAECGDPFRITTPAKSSRFEPNRRCQRHKRPGQRVQPKGDAQ